MLQSTEAGKKIEDPMQNFSTVQFRKREREEKNGAKKERNRN